MIRLIACLCFLVACIVIVDIACGHGIHFHDVINKQCPVVAQGELATVGYVFGTDCDGDDLADHFYQIYKDGDLTHMGLHVKPLTKESAARIMAIEKEVR